MPRRTRRRPDCTSVLLVLTVVAAGAWVVVHAITAWITGHPEVVVLAVVMACAGGAGADRLSARRVRTLAAGTEFTALSPAEFEQAVAALCRRDGCRDVRVVGGAGDLAADVLATDPGGRRILLQAKRYAPGHRVGSPDVQRVGGTYSVVHGAALAIVVTTSSFTAEAEGYARTAGIRLIDGGELAAWAARTTAPPWA